MAAQPAPAAKKTFTDKMAERRAAREKRKIEKQQAKDERSKDPVAYDLEQKAEQKQALEGQLDNASKFKQKSIKKKIAKLEGELNAPRIKIRLEGPDGKIRELTATTPLPVSPQKQARTAKAKAGAQKFGSGVKLFGKLAAGVFGVLLPKTSGFIGRVFDGLKNIFNAGKEFCKEIHNLVGKSAEKVADQQGFNLNEKNGQMVLESKDGTPITEKNLDNLNDGINQELVGKTMKVDGQEYKVVSIGDSPADKHVAQASQEAHSTPAPKAEVAAEQKAEKTIEKEPEPTTPTPSPGRG